MQTADSSLIKWIDFGNEAGDDVDPQELSSYFVEQDLFLDFQKPANKLLVATGKKGVGKSALLSWLGTYVERAHHDAIVVKCTGADLARPRFGLTHELVTPNDHIRDWMVRICTLINRRIANSINWAWTDDEISLVEAAEIDGFKSKNLISCLGDRFSKLLGNVAPEKIPLKDEVEALRNGKERTIWFLLDDLDATFQNTPQECLSLSTFFTACRYLTRDVKGICFRVALRTDVWPIVRRSDESLDKMEQYVRDIVWHKKDFRSLLFKRIKAQLEKLKINPIRLSANLSDEEREEYYIKKIFVPRMAWGEYESVTYRVIYTLSYHRPRWAIQLIEGEFEHYHFNEMPDFLSSKTTDDFGVLWEIHPCFREALDIVKLNHSQRLRRKQSEQ